MLYYCWQGCKVQNLNNTYNETLDKNFKQAVELYETKYSHQQLLELLKNGNIPEKQIAVLKMEGIYSVDEARILMDNLTGQDGKIREAVSLKLKEFMSDSKTLQFFKGKEFCNVFLDAVIDINGNICRNVISSIENLRNDDEFCSVFCDKLYEITKELITIVEKFDFKDGKYKVNKEAFKLYWCLETMYVFWDKIEIQKLKNIVMRSKNIQEYTIREKTAKILTRNFVDADLVSAREELKNDINYYVRRF